MEFVTSPFKRNVVRTLVLFFVFLQEFEVCTIHVSVCTLITSHRLHNCANLRIASVSLSRSLIARWVRPRTLGQQVSPWPPYKSRQMSPDVSARSLTHLRLYFRERVYLNLLGHSKNAPSPALIFIARRPMYIRSEITITYNLNDDIMKL